MKVRPERSIYVRALLWAYEKQHAGFTKEEMKAALNLNDDEWTWIHWMFFIGLNGAAPLIWSIPEEYRNDNRHFGQDYYLSAAGIAAAVDYLELKEAQKSGRVAFWTAIVSIGIAIIASILNIIVRTCCR